MRRLLLLVVGFMLVLPGAGAMAIEQPTFDVVSTWNDIEIRQYAAMNVARTRVDGEFDEVGNTGFRRLAGYIFGGNAQDQKIAMTSPVTQAQSGQPGRHWVNFMMPAEYDLDALPVPMTDDVELVHQPARTMAVIRYKGGWSEAKFVKYRDRLLAQLPGSGFRAAGEVIWARYNPPFIPSFLRTNEVMVPVEPE